MVRCLNLFVGVAVGCLLLGHFQSLQAQPRGFNYDESKVPQFTLPEPLVTQAGKKVTTADQWKQQRRPEILALFEQHVYGVTPTDKVHAEYSVESGEAYDGLATRKQVTIHLERNGRKQDIHVLMYLPKKRNAAAPVFIGLNFRGNHTVTDDPAVHLPTSWMRKDSNTDGNKATERGRGASKSRWQIPLILEHGFAIATVYYGDIDPDTDDGFKNGVHALFDEPEQRSPHAWGSIAAWSWGLSRLVDYLETDRDVDSRHIALIGHSRLGKTSLWAGAQDQRIGLVISNNSGCGGAALSRREFGETVKRINTSFPHWFCKKFHDYNDDVNSLPVDQHLLTALIAPRPLYVASAEQDQWADPQGEFLAAKLASPVYKLLGADGLPADTQPALNEPSQGGIGYHIRTGKHDVTEFDWQQYLKFARMHFSKSDS